jgi:hypothetical protein
LFKGAGAAEKQLAALEVTLETAMAATVAGEAR